MAGIGTVLGRFPRGAGRSCTAQMICLMPSRMALFSGNTVSSVRVYELWPWVSDRLHHDSEHCVSWRSQTSTWTLTVQSRWERAATWGWPWIMGTLWTWIFLSLPWRFSGMISCLLWDYSAWSTQCVRLPRALPPPCHGLPPAASTVFTKVSVMALPTTSSSLSCCLGELQIPDHQTRVFQNAVPTCQHFPSCLFRPSAAEFLPAPKLNHFSLSLSLPTEYWVVQALSASALSHPPLKVKWRSALLFSPWFTLVCRQQG